MKDSLERAALLAHQKYMGDKNAAIDPTQLFNWAQIIFDLIAKCRERQAQGMIDAAKRPGMIVRIATTRTVERHSHPSVPRSAVKAKAEAVLATCAEANPQELQALIDEVVEG